MGLEQVPEGCPEGASSAQEHGQCWAAPLPRGEEKTKFNGEGVKSENILERTKKGQFE